MDSPFRHAGPNRHDGTMSTHLTILSARLFRSRNSRRVSPWQSGRPSAVPIVVVTRLFYIRFCCWAARLQIALPGTVAGCLETFSTVSIVAKSLLRGFRRAVVATQALTRILQASGQPLPCSRNLMRVFWRDASSLSREEFQTELIE
jgi:hypothetical protein